MQGLVGLGMRPVRRDLIDLGAPGESTWGAGRFPIRL